MPAPLTPPLQPPDVRLLTELGFVAAGAGLHRQARTVFEGLLALRPERAFPYIGLATVDLNSSQAESARHWLQRGRAVLADMNPNAAEDAAQHLEDRALLAAFDGLALHLCRRSAESRQALYEALALQQDGPAARMARVMLGKENPT